MTVMLRAAKNGGSGSNPGSQPNPSHEVNKFLRAWRESRKLTQTQLARRINKGVSTISGWETGARQVDLADLDLLAKEYGVHPAALLFAPEEAGPTVTNMREASDLAQTMDPDALAEWLSLGRRLAGRKPGD